MTTSDRDQLVVAVKKFIELNQLLADAQSRILVRKEALRSQLQLHIAHWNVDAPHNTSEQLTYEETLEAIKATISNMTEMQIRLDVARNPLIEAIRETPKTDLEQLSVLYPKLNSVIEGALSNSIPDQEFAMTQYEALIVHLEKMVDDDSS